MLPWKKLTENRIKWQDVCCQMKSCCNQTKQMGDDAEDAQHSSD